MVSVYNFNYFKSVAGFFFFCGSGYGLGICSVSTEEDECSAVE